MALFRFGNGMDDMFGHMDNMMNQLMGGMFPDPFNMNVTRPMAMNPFNPLGQFQNMMQQTVNMNMGMQNAPGSFVSSSFVSYSSNGNNPPQIYEETKMNQYGPGGVREERHTVRDSRTGLQKMKIGRHIQDRGHVMERSKNHYTGDEEENNEFINIEEEEAPQFQQEWTSRMASSRPNYDVRCIQGPQGPRAPRLAITAGPSHQITEIPATCSTSSTANENSRSKLKIKSPTLKNKKSKKPKKNE